VSFARELELPDAREMIRALLDELVTQLAYFLFEYEASTTKR